MVPALICLALVFWGRVFGVICAALTVSIYFILLLVVPEKASLLLPVVCIMALSVALAGYIAGLLLEKFGFNKFQSPALQTMCFVLPLAIGFAAPTGSDFLISSIDVAIKSSNTMDTAGFLLLVVERTIFCGTIAAFVIMVIELLFELPFLWFCNAYGFLRKPNISLEGIRAITIVALCAFGFDLIASFFVGDLWPKLGIH